MILKDTYLKTHAFNNQTLKTHAFNNQTLKTHDSITNYPINVTYVEIEMDFLSNGDRALGISR